MCDFKSWLEDLRYFREYASGPYKEMACNMLIKQGTSNDDLRHIIEYAPEAYADLARQLLNK